MKKQPAIFFFLLFLLCLFVSNSIWAADETREVTGYGVTRKEAIVNAQLEALQQIKGARLKGVEDLRSYFKEEYDSKNGEDTSSSRMSADQREKIHREIQGIITSYDVIDLSPGENGHGWEATLSVTVPVYKPPGISPHSRRKLAVMPFRTVKTSYSIGGSRIPSREISREFSQKLVDELTQSRRFTVLDREYICEYFKEENLVLSGEMPLQEQIRLGQVLGVDYMLVGTISNVELERVAYRIKMLDRTGYKNKAKFIADYRIIVMPNRQVKWSDSVTMNLGTDALRRLTKSDDPEIIQYALLEEGARKIAHKALANIYPIRVSAIQPDGRLILNQGGKTVSEGELLDIFKVGDKVVDPYSGESLGAAETWIATAKVERVLPKQSYAEVIKGDVDSVQVKDICRRVKKKKQTPPKKEKQIAVPW